MKCPVCEQHELAHDNCLDICPICNWQNDGIQYDAPDYNGGANWLSLNRTRENRKRHGTIMTERDHQERKAFYQAHVASDGTWITYGIKAGCTRHELIETIEKAVKMTGYGDEMVKNIILYSENSIEITYNTGYIKSIDIEGCNGIAIMQKIMEVV